SAGCDRPIGRPEDLAVAPAGEWLDLETSTSRVGGFPRWTIRLERALFARLIGFVIAGDRKIGLFDAGRFKAEVVANAVSASLADGFRATIDCTPAHADAIGARLADAETAGIARFGLSRQDAAMMISFIPHWTSPNHLHFIDGAGGGLGAAERLMAEKTS
ncbi:MAG TPA: DUF3095 family protein, partial [Beijerinckiaceae bacterium]|nr:DUF3095 family protein [Beijerinckiaceae bacterium]